MPDEEAGPAGIDVLDVRPRCRIDDRHHALRVEGRDEGQVADRRAWTGVRRHAGRHLGHLYARGRVEHPDLVRALHRGKQVPAVRRDVGVVERRLAVAQVLVLANREVRIRRLDLPDGIHVFEDHVDLRAELDDSADLARDHRTAVDRPGRLERLDDIERVRVEQDRRVRLEVADQQVPAVIGHSRAPRVDPDVD